MLHTNRSPFHINDISPINSNYMNHSNTANLNSERNYCSSIEEEELSALKEAFTLYDTKQKGFLDSKQFNSILRNLNFIDKEKLKDYLAEEAEHRNANDTVDFDKFAITLIELLPTDNGCTTSQTVIHATENTQHSHREIDYTSLDEKLSLKDEEEEGKKGSVGDEEIMACFQAFDLDKDGRISQRDLEQVMARLGTPLTQQELKNMIAIGDKNKDGFIDFEEFKQLLPSSR